MIYRVVTTILMFFAGVWVFNHFPYPFVGIVIAFGYPVFLLTRFFKKGNL